MITGVQDIYYNVTDVARSVAFYRDHLQMELLDESEHWASLQLHGFRIGLHWTEGQALPEVPRDAHGAHAGGTLTLRSDAAAEDAARLKAAGVKVIGEADAPWGYMVVFEDPDGNVLKLMQPKLA